MNEVKLIQSVRQHEGYRAKAYTDTAGVWTAGYGRNLQTMTVSSHVAEEWLAEDVYLAEAEAKKFYEWRFLDTDARQNAFVEMVYNLGSGGVAKFENMLLAIRQSNWVEAAKQALDSKWATQVGKRGLTLIAMLQTGEFPV